MKPEELLQKAAEETNLYYAQQWEAQCAGMAPPVFSGSFSKKMRRLTRRADHPARYRALRCAAALFLALLVGLSAWLTFDRDARAALVNWFKGLRGQYFVYENTGETAAVPGEYRPTWLPEGYRESQRQTTADAEVIIYANEEGDRIRFWSMPSYQPPTLFLDVDTMEHRSVEINGIQAECFISQDPSIASSLSWASDDGTAFWLSGYLSQEELTKIALSIK